MDGLLRSSESILVPGADCFIPRAHFQFGLSSDGVALCKPRGNFNGYLLAHDHREGQCTTA